MGYFQVRYDSRGVNYDRRGFIRLATDVRGVRMANFCIDHLYTVHCYEEAKIKKKGWKWPLFKNS